MMGWDGTAISDRPTTIAPLKAVLRNIGKKYEVDWMVMARSWCVVVDIRWNGLAHGGRYIC